MAERLRNIVEVPEVKLVIELDDADSDPEGIISNFVFTEEVEESLRIVLKRIDDSKGCGIFIKGNFGSGKSHFLSYLYLLLKEKNTLNLPFLDDYPWIKAGDINAVKVSLVKYPASQNLEDIILTSLGYKGSVLNREETFKGILNRDTVIIIDELSEFLRSKPTPSAFYEDTRFLQFIGEFSFHHPLWIVASLQEWIEETGHISASTFNRIKDRYPIRVNLTSSHIEDIIDKRIVLKKEGSEEVIEGVFSELKKYYPDLSLKFEEFKKTYPLHPITVRFLSGLTPVFSQHRGVIQFVFRAVRDILDEPPDTLITPEVIFDHFEERIREVPEYSRLVRVVYDYYRTHIDEILSNANQKEIALSAIKVMILTEISPLEKRKTHKDITEILLKKISTITSGINYEFIKDGVLEPLVAHQMYIIKEGDLFYIDPRVDEGIRIKGRIKALRERFADRNYLFTELCNHLNMPYLPLKDVAHGKGYKFLWQNSMRECVVILMLHGQLKKDEIERMLDGLEKRLDGFLVILSPFMEEKGRIYTIKEAYPSSFLPSLLFWVPREFTEDEILFLEGFIARHHLLKEFPEIEAEIKRDEAAFREAVSNAYFSGEIVYGSGRIEKNLKDIGYLPIEKLLGHLFDQSLLEIHPNHYRIMPRVDYFSTHHLSSLFSHCIRYGKITIDEAEKKGLTPYIKGLLEPMGIVKKRGGSFLISLDAENDLVSHFLNLVSHEDDLTKIKTCLKKGRWGMSEAQINLIVSAFVVSGYIVPYRGDDMIELKEFSQLQTGEVTKIRQGKVLSPQLLGYIHHGRFIWGDVEETPTPLTQKMMWKEAVELIRKTRKMLEETNHFISRYKDYSIFKRLNIDTSLFNRLSLFLNSITLSLPPAEGLERILSHLRENLALERDFIHHEGVHRFLTREFQTINKYYLYLTHPSLRLKGELEKMKKDIITSIEEFIRAPDKESLSIRDEWEGFYERFTDTYKDGHEKYYQSPVFRIKKELEESEEGRTLKRITMTVGFIVFDLDWWEIKRELDVLPDKCPWDLNYELFQNPICRCGYKIGDEPSSVDTDFIKTCSAGIVNFITHIQKPEYRERIESYILGISDMGNRDTADKITSLLSLNLKDINLSPVLTLLTDDTLKEIEHALKGKWKIKEIRIDDLINDIKGRRLRFNELKEMFFKWIGDEEESIIWVKGEEETNISWVSEDLAKYGIQGERLLREITSDYGIDGIEEKLKQDGMLDGIRWQNLSLEELFRFIDSEKFDFLKKRLREEIFYRLWDRTIREEILVSVNDELTRDMLTTIKMLNAGDKHKGAELFTKVIAPLNLLMEKTGYENETGEKISYDAIEKIKGRFDNIVNVYNSSADKLNGIREIGYIKEHITGVVAIFDGLRYDLWLMLKEEFIKQGFVIKDEPFMVSPPSTTSNFRKALGIEDRGNINGRSYVLLKWAERGIGKKGLKNILKDDADIKFLHFNFIDIKAHASSLNLYPLYLVIRDEFLAGIMPILKNIPSFLLVSDHGFSDTNKLKERYVHGGKGIWECILPFAEIKCRI
ncbi:MAG: DUF6079 family protein [Nitrospirota bacterium]